MRELRLSKRSQFSEPQRRCRCDFCWNNHSVSAIFGSVPEPSNFTDIYETNKCQRLRDSVDWTYLRIWVLLGPWDIDERQSALFRV